VYDEFSPFALKRDISLVLKLDKDIPMLLIDSDRIKQVTENLLTNALKWTPKGGSVILATESDSWYVMVRIIDSGPGIPVERIENIFNPYSRQEDDRQQFTGLGLGLSLCKNIIELHHGKIWVIKNPDKGSTFIFSLPKSYKG
ncbi:MAG: ATP-binding protein, partial [Chloroflexi bacterium]|nr:ATP-binding protein [Chloroflexota bacterium]